MNLLHLFRAVSVAPQGLESGSNRSAASRLWTAILGTAALTLVSSSAQAASFSGLGDLPGGTFRSFANAVSANGSVVVGISNSTNGNEAFRWTAIDGMEGLGDLPGGTFSSQARSVSADGSTIVGFSNSTNGEEAFYWTESDGMRFLSNILTDDFGLDLTGWTLQQARGVSADGLTIVGTGTNPDGNEEAWIAQLDPVSTPDPSTLIGLGTLALTTGALLKRKRQA